MLTVYLACTVAVLTYMVGCFIASLVVGRNDIADVAWGPGFILAAAVSLVVGGVYAPRGLLLSALVVIWGTRLALHIHARNRGRGEDPRYRAWRETWGRWFLPRSFLQVFMLQGTLLVLVCSPIILVNAAQATPMGVLDALGGMLWLLGFTFEVVGDRQLSRFVRSPANGGKLMTEGLWRYSRHPNYFGEVTLWWGVWVMALSVPGGWATVVGPVTITGLILWISGIPMLERRYFGRPDYEAYRRRTSAFFPLPPRGE